MAEESTVTLSRKQAAAQAELLWLDNMEELHRLAMAGSQEVLEYITCLMGRVSERQ